MLTGVTLVSDNWNQVVSELSDWYKFGLEVQEFLNDKENAPLELVFLMLLGGGGFLTKLASFEEGIKVG